MVSLITDLYIFKLTKKKNYIFNMEDVLIHKILLPTKEHLNYFWDILRRKNIIVIFNTDDMYDYKTILNIDTFEFLNWEFTK